MFSAVELSRIFAEWRLRLQRAFNILNPPQWSREEWKRFSKALAVLARQHGAGWTVEAEQPPEAGDQAPLAKSYWDLRWELQGGGHLICQVEHVPSERTTLVVAQTGGFATELGSYTWLWAEFDAEGEFSRDLYWVDGSWKEALITLLFPYQSHMGFYLSGPAESPKQLMANDGVAPSASASDSASRLLKQVA
ncbi:MAG: hypothetical protein JO317_06270 [Verrucomicrobiae bacterium]|nr:hypothetical protein [Verrucomicrobiae bacterium]